MAQSNAAFALLTLGQWCRNHGIYEIRDVLAKAGDLAAGAESSELLAAALEEASIAADVVIEATPEPGAKEPAGGPEEKDTSPRKPHRRARVGTGHFKADDPATAENEAWEAAD